MKRLNNYARHSLFIKLVLPLIILLIFNILLRSFGTEELVKLYILAISIFLLLASIAVVIFYPKIMNVRIQVLRYDGYLYDTIKSYEKWLESIKSRIEVTELLSDKHFIIARKKRKERTPEVTAKLIEAAKLNKAEILKDYQLEYEKIEERLNSYKQERAECSNFLINCHEKPGHAS